MRPIKVGRNRQRVGLYDVPELTRDSYGQPSQAATLLGTYWAEVRPLRGGEQLNVRAQWATATHQVTLRWLGSGVTISPRMKLVITRSPGTRTLNILGVTNVEERNRSWLCTCEEKYEATS